MVADGDAGEQDLSAVRAVRTRYRKFQQVLSSCGKRCAPLIRVQQIEQLLVQAVHFGTYPCEYHDDEQPPLWYFHEACRRGYDWMEHGIHQLLLILHNSEFLIIRRQSAALGLGARSR